MPDALLLEGEIDREALEHAFAALLERHESLRTTFVTVDGELRQKVHPSIDSRLSFIDLTASDQPELQARELARQDAQTLFDLERGPLIRMSLLKLAQKRHVLLSNMHHIISDGWSIAVLEREFVGLYQSFQKGQDLPLPPLRIQYRDYAAWQNRSLESNAVAPHRDYWLEKLAGEIPVLNLPTDFPRPAVKTFNGKTFSFNLNAAQSRALLAFSRRNNATLFMTLMALLKTLLYRYTDQQDIIIGCPVAGRDHADLKDQIGFYVNTLPLRSQVLPDLSFEAFLDQVRTTCTDAYEHQAYPFDRLVHELNLNRDISRSPLFDVMLALQNVEGSDLSFEDLHIAPFFDQYTTSQFDLTFSFEERDDALHATLWYNTDLFLPDRIVRLSHHFQQLVASILDDASRPLGQLNILPEPERHQLLNEFNTAADYRCDQTIVELFEAQVERNPEAVALVFEDQLLTYRELNARANQLAHHLLALGVRPNALVGICAQRSLDMVVGLLGILKAGAAYVPFDLAYPNDRLAFMLNDSQVPVLLTQHNLAARLPTHQAQVLCLDQDWDLIARQSQDNPPAQAAPENLAYVIYTSGSTGQPKGTLVTHHNVTRLFAATRAWFHFDQRDVWTLFHSYAFDFSVWELWGALLHGGRLVIVPYWISRSPEAFYDLLCAQRVTVLNQTPSAFRQLIQVDQSSAATTNLRLVIFGGEALELQSLKPWFERHGDLSPQLVNMYGITETTVHVTYRPLTAADLNCTASLIGSPIPDLQVYILDQHLHPVPIGIPGEMYVAGAGLAPSYFQRPDLTAERFIPNPFSTLPGARLYKSGDLARYQPSGDIEYFGRLDHQVKIRGFRVELGEIETVLASHPAVRAAVVIERQDQPGHKILVAYVVPDPLHTLSIGELRNLLKEKLPDYMIPSAFVILDLLPLTAHGKIDRRALPPPDGARASSEDGFVAPRTDLEKVLAGIYAETLGLKQVGIHENFFELGGHSLLATQVVSRVRDSLRVEVPLPLFFRAGTVAELAVAVLHSEGDKKQAERIARALEKLKGMSEEEKRNVIEEKRKVRSQS
jgi:amino acid adenylation domain-containing protein